MPGVVAFGWLVLAAVFLDEILAMAALGLVGWSASPRWLLTWALPLLAMLAWVLFASPRARLGTPVRRPAVKVLVFGLAALGLWSTGHRGSAAGLATFSVAVNALAMIPPIRDLPTARTAPAMAGED